MTEDFSSRKGTETSSHGSVSSKSIGSRPKRNYTPRQANLRRQYRGLAEAEVDRIKQAHSDKRTAWKAISRDLRDQLVAMHMEVEEETPERSAKAIDDFLDNAIERNTIRGRVNWDKVASRLINKYKNLYVDYAQMLQA